MKGRPNRPETTWGNCAAAAMLLGAVLLALVLGLACMGFLNLFRDMEFRLGP